MRIARRSYGETASAAQPEFGVHDSQCRCARQLGGPAGCGIRALREDMDGTVFESSVLSSPETSAGPSGSVDEWPMASAAAKAVARGADGARPPGNVVSWTLKRDEVATSPSRASRASVRAWPWPRVHRAVNERSDFQSPRRFAEP